MEENTCSKCGKKFENYYSLDLCEDCRRKKKTEIYLVIAIIILILGFIGGIVLGNQYKVLEKQHVFGSYYEMKEAFNVGLMIYCWIGTMLFDIFVFGIYSICHRLDLLIEKK